MIMHRRSDGKTTICMARGTIDHRMSSPSELILNSLLARSTRDVAVWQKKSFLCVRISMKRGGGSYVCLSMLAPVLLMFAARWSLHCAGASKVIAFMIWSMATSGSLSVSGLLFLPVVESRGSASTAWGFIPARCIKSKSSSDKRRRQSTCRLVESAR